MNKKIKQIKKKYPKLTVLGFSNKKVDGDSLEDHLEEIKMVMNLLKGVEKRKTINLNHGSYELKHIAETILDTYISNGIFIVASLIIGFDIRIQGINCCFNMSSKSIKILHNKACELRENTRKFYK